MKKRRLKLLLTAGFGGTVLVIFAGLCLLGRPVVRFRFLDGHRPVWRRNMGSTATWRNETWDYYRFEGDFNDVYAEAVAELAALGFTEGPVPKVGVPYYRGINVGIGQQGHFFDSVTPTSVVWVLLTGSDGRVYVRVGSTHAGIRDRIRYWARRGKRRPPSGRTRPAPRGGR